MKGKKEIINMKEGGEVNYKSWIDWNNYVSKNDIGRYTAEKELKIIGITDKT